MESPIEAIPVRHRVRLPDVSDRPSFNPSICGDKVLVRTSTYDLHDDGNITLHGRLNSKNYLLTFTPDGWASEEFAPENHLLWDNGLEDGRLFYWNDRLWVLFSACFQANKSKWRIVSRNTMVLMDVETKEFVPLHTDTMREKNWMPIPSETLHFLYSVSPWVVLGQHADVVRNDPGPGRKWSGSSQFIPFEGKWLGVVHRRSEPGIYEHAFVLMDEDLSFNRISKPFRFHGEQIEFCAGMSQSNNSVYLSYGIMDREAWIAEVDKGTVRDFLKR